MQNIDKNSVIKALKNFRFIVVKNGSETIILEYLRSMGVVSLFQIHRVGEYIIIEPNAILCERECNPYCIEDDGRSAEECRLSCINTCIDSKVEYILKKLS